MSVIALTRRPPRLRSTVTVREGSPTGSTVNQLLLGGLHPFGWPDNPTPALAKAQAGGVVKIQRTDKCLSTTPIKAGGTDGTHPTLGHSGNWSYDWQVVDRMLADAASQGAQLYISIDSCPQILGGSVAPYSGSALTSKLPGYATFAPQIPDDLAAFAEMAVDLVHYITVTKGVDVPYWGVWNEPDGSTEFWLDPDTGLQGTAAQWFEMYAAVATAVKAFNSAIKVGGPEMVDPVNNFTVWAKGLMDYCLTNGVPLDFLSTHDYSASGWTLHSFNAKVERAKTDLGYTDPLEIVNGEWNMTHAANAPGHVGPFEDDDLTTDDQSAAAVALQLIEMQRLGVARGVYFKPDSEPLGSGLSVSGLFSNDGPWATGNVFRLWDRIGAADVVEHDIAADPGIHAMAATRDGTLYVLLTSHHYRRGPQFPVTIELPDTANGRATILTVIDQDRSNRYDAGLDNAELQTVGVADVAGGRVQLHMQARSVCLLEVAP